MVNTIINGLSKHIKETSGELSKEGDCCYKHIVISKDNLEYIQNRNITLQNISKKLQVDFIYVLNYGEI